MERSSTRLDGRPAIGIGLLITTREAVLVAGPINIAIRWGLPIYAVETQEQQSWKSAIEKDGGAV